MAVLSNGNNEQGNLWELVGFNRWASERKAGE
jgi:hypothetical protein